MAKKGKKQDGAPGKRKSRKQLEEEARRQKEEEEKEAMLQEERRRQAEEDRKLKKLKEEREAANQATRDTQLKATCCMFRDLSHAKLMSDIESRDSAEWKRYVDPRGLPRVEVPSAMNTYLHLWQQSEETSHLEDLGPKFDEVMGLLEILDSLLDNPLERTDKRLIENWKEVRQSYREELQRRLDLGCFHVMRDMENLMDRKGLHDSHFEYSCHGAVVLRMYSRYRAPGPPMKAPQVACQEAGIEVVLPETPFGVNGPGWMEPIVVRVMRLRYDHFSDQCGTWNPPPLMADFSRDLYSATLENWLDKVFLKERREQALIRQKEELMKAQAAALPWWERAAASQPAESEEEAAEEVAEEETLPQDVEEDLAPEVEPEEELEESAVLEDVADVAEEEKVDQKEMEEGGSGASIVSDDGFELFKRRAATLKADGVTVILDEDVDYSSLSSGEPLSYTSLEEFSQSVLYDSDLESLESEDSDPKGMVNFGETLTNMKAAAEAEEEKAFMPSQKSGGEAEPGELELLPRRSYPRLPWDEDQDVVGITELVKAFGQAKEDTSVKNVLEVRKSIRTSTAGTSSPGLDDETILAKCPSEIMDESDALALQELNASLTYRAATEGELNLRKFRVLGGVYYVDLTEQPPQEYVLKDRSKVKLLFGPYALRRKEFAVEYRPPAVVESEDKDDTSAEKSQASYEDINRLLSVEIGLPDDVLWFDPPTPVQWDDSRKVWTNEWVFEPKYNEDKRMVQFRLCRLEGWPIGLAACRFSNLPYQTWELKPELGLGEGEPQEVVFTLTANIVIAVFHVRCDRVSLRQLQNATGTALEAVLGRWYDPHVLIRIMRSGGVDLFPDHDSYLYVEGSAMKDFVLEYHLYHCMALLSPAFNFTWSRWNLLAGPKKLVLQMREYTCRKRIPQYSTLLVRRDASLLVDCNEVSPSFSEQAIGTSDLDSLWTEDEPEEEVVTCIDKPETGEEFYPDLHSLAEALATRRAKETLEKPETRLVETVFFLLKATKVMSYS